MEFHHVDTEEIGSSDHRIIRPSEEFFHPIVLSPFGYHASVHEDRGRTELIRVHPLDPR